MGGSAGQHVVVGKAVECHSHPRAKRAKGKAQERGRQSAHRRGGMVTGGGKKRERS